LFIHVGIDDTDSRGGQCTTYIASKIISKLINYEFIDYPNLVRLNPNVPWKTKGNAAVCFRFHADNPKEIFSKISKIVKQQAPEESHSGIVLYEGEKINVQIKNLYKDALNGIININRAKRIIKENGILSYGGLGVIGALSSIGADFKKDHTFEIIAYRKKENWGMKRNVDYNSVVKMDEITGKDTFSNIDSEKEKLLVSPNGPDPVLVGIRGENPMILIKALNLVELGEKIESFIIFRSNQGTGEHLNQQLDVNKLKSYSSGYINGQLSRKAWVEKGGHVYFEIIKSDNSCICAVYEPAGDLRKIATQLNEGDYLKIYGGIRKPTTKHKLVLNVEQIEILEMNNSYKYMNDICKQCEKRMESMGFMKGYRCEKCGKRYPYAKKMKSHIERDIKPGIYLPPLRSQRHLTKPYSRFNLEKNNMTNEIKSNWFWFA